MLRFEKNWSVNTVNIHVQKVIKQILVLIPICIPEIVSVN
jgi:hypothetical protein